MIRIGVKGKIASGEERGRFVLIQDDRDGSGGFLIVTAADRKHTVEGADCWLESREALAQFVEESDCVIEWETA